MANVNLNIRVEQEFGLSSPIEISHAARVFREVSLHFEQMLGKQKKWYLKGYSRKQALQHKVFIDGIKVPKKFYQNGKKDIRKFILFLERVFGTVKLMIAALGLI